MNLTANNEDTSYQEVDMTTKVADMTGPELVAAYNELAESEAGKLCHLRPVQRFSTREAGIARLEAAQSSIKAYREGIKGLPEEAPAVEAGVAEGDSKKKPAKAPKEAKAPKAPKKNAPIEGENAILTSFQAREGTNRKRMLHALCQHFGSQIAIPDLIKATYGKDADVVKLKGPFSMVLGGATVMIKKHHLPYQIKKGKDGKTPTVGLYHKE
jgi:hypothetical protein